MPRDALLDVPQRSTSLQAAGELKLQLPSSMRDAKTATTVADRAGSLDRQRAFEGQRGSTSTRKMNWRLLCNIRSASLLLPALRHTPMLTAVSGASASASPDAGVIGTVLAACAVQGGGGLWVLRVVLIVMAGLEQDCILSDYLRDFEMVGPSQMAYIKL